MLTLDYCSTATMLFVYIYACGQSDAMLCFHNCTHKVCLSATLLPHRAHFGTMMCEMCTVLAALFDSASICSV
jgi:hypothetical protein